jgi:fused signal recognition particle receptor
MSSDTGKQPPFTTTPLWQRVVQRTTALFGAASTSAGALNTEDVERLEEALFRSDMDAAMVDALLAEVAPLHTAEERQQAVKNWCIQRFDEALPPANLVANAPHVFMLVGINGSGKTTTISKLAHYFHQQGRPVFIIGADTYRAAADAQLTAWCERLNTPYITAASLGLEKANPAYVVSEALQRFQTHPQFAPNAIVLVDTSGRLHVDAPLMEELAKVQRSIVKTLIHQAQSTPEHVHSLLILDATTGQNALKQVLAFNETLGLSGLILTKLDASAKGGALFGIVRETRLQPWYITSGEQVDAFHLFDADAFTTAVCEALPI